MVRCKWLACAIVEHASSRALQRPTMNAEFALSAHFCASDSSPGFDKADVRVHAEENRTREGWVIASLRRLGPPTRSGVGRSADASHGAHCRRCHDPPPHLICSVVALLECLTGRKNSRME